MAGRLRGGLPLLIAGLLLQTGCVSMLPWENGTAPTPPKADDAAKATETLPSRESAELCYSLGEKFEKSGKLGEAAAQYELAKRYNPGLKDVEHRLATVYDAIGKIQDAIKSCEKELVAKPHDAVLLNDLGAYYFDLGSWTQAEKYFRQALAVNAEYKLASNNLGMTLGQEERYSEGMEAFQKAVSPAEAECNMGFIYLTQGKRVEAHGAYERALSHDPTCQIARAVLVKLDQASEVVEPPHITAKTSGERPKPLALEDFAAPVETPATDH